jgi:hypothetical protein
VIHSGKVLVHIGNLKPIDFEEFLAIGRDVFPYTDAMPSRAQKVALADRGMECVWHILIPFFKPLHNTAHQLYSIRNSLRKGATNSLSLFGPNGSGAFFCFRRQKAADDRDKIYAFIGLQDDFLSSLQPSYLISKASLYAIITRGSFAADLRNILGIECWERIPARGDELSSWVIDFSKEQNLTARLKFEEHWPGFQADFGFPPLPCMEDEPYLKQDILDPDLIIRGMDVAVVTAVYDMGLPEQLIPGQDKVLVLRYDTNRQMSESQIIQRSSASDPILTENDVLSTEYDQASSESTDIPEVNMMNTSWAPCHTQVGDIIIVAAGCNTPLVLRKENEKYLLVGGVWLIDSELETENKDDERTVICQEGNNGFSRLMYGAACEGKTLDDVELFTLC